MKNNFESINDTLQYQKNTHPKKIAYRFILNDDDCVTIDYETLYFQVRSLSSRILQHTKPGDRVLLSSSPGLDFIVGFYACLMARTIAVPIIPPANAMMATRFLQVIKDASPQLILLDKKTASTLGFSQKIDSFVPSILKRFVGIQDAHAKLFEALRNQQMITLVIDELVDVKDISLPICEKNDVAFLQYTSGSTGAPKGVMITHANLLHNMSIINKVVNHSDASHVFSWLPPYHDMGLIAGILEPLYSGITATLMSTLDFIERPSRWVEGISKYQCTTTGGPNFAFEICALKTSDELVKKLDLSRLEVAANGAEPLNHASMELFYNRFKEAGLRAGVILPCYGLAESTVMVSGNQFLTSALVLDVNADGLKNNHIEMTEKNKLSKPLISSGIPQFDVKIVNPDTLDSCPPFEVGEIWIRGESVAKGYFNQALESEKTFQAHIKGDETKRAYLRSGDLGFIHHGELFVCGRIKNMIIIRGQNYYPQDFEFTVTNAHQSIKKGCVVAYAMPSQGKELLVIVAAVRDQTAPSEFPVIVDCIKREISIQFHLLVHQIILVSSKAIPKTTSGKLQRLQCQENIESGLIKPLWSVILEDNGPKETPNNSDWMLQFKHAPKNERRELVKQLVLSTTAELLSLKDVSTIDIHKGFFDLGMDSMMAVELKTNLEEKLNHIISIDNTLVFNFPNIEAVISHLLKELEFDNQKSTIPPSVDKIYTEHEDIAIIGMSCTFPGAKNIDEFWRLLVDGKDGICDVPSNRWNGNDYYSDEQGKAGKMVVNRGGFIENIECFDPSFFSISPKEMECLDPQQRLLLMNAWTAFEHAQLDPLSFRGTNTGVFIGISSHDYETLILKNVSEKDMNLYWGTGNAASTASGRLSYFFGLEGPNMAIETACSSSLVALHEACRSLQHGECGTAVVGGVNAMLSPELSLVFSKAGMLAPDGKCKTFDEKADGYVRGEGCGMVVIKRLSDAIKDNNPIWAVIKASGINQDGASSGLTVPSGSAQERLLAQVLSDSHLNADNIDYIECHGTGTKLGDPIEVHAIGAVYGQGRDENHKLQLGSVKTNIGHLEAAAGIAGLIKVALSLTHHKIPKHLNFNQLNSNINLNFPAEVVIETKEWHGAGKPRRAALSSFGFSGTNAHVILEEAPVSKPKDETILLSKDHLFVLSAKSKKSIEEEIQLYIDYLERSPESLEDICYSAATSRGHFVYRLAVIVKDKEVLLKQLKAKAFEIIEAQLVDELVQSDDLSTIGNEYLLGKRIDWVAFYKPYIKSLHTVSLPTYCFDTQRYWLDIKKTKVLPYGEVIHELLGAKLPGHAHVIRFMNKLDLNNIDYLKEHKIYNHVIFPGAGFVESALSAGINVLGDNPLVLKDVSLLAPLVLETAADYELNLELSANGVYEGNIYARQASDWVHHVDFKLEQLSNSYHEVIDLEQLKASMDSINIGMLYQQFGELGLDYGKSFQNIQEAYVQKDKALVSIKNDSVITKGYYLHPALLDGVFQAMALLSKNQQTTYIPSAISRITWYQKAQGGIWANVTRLHQDANLFIADIKIIDDNGMLIASIEAFSARAITKQALEKMIINKGNIGCYVEDYDIYVLPELTPTQEDLLGEHVVFVYEENIEALVEQAKALLNKKPASFTLVTNNAFALTNEDINPEHTKALGFWKSFYQEAGFPCYVIDRQDQDDISSILALICKGDMPETQLIVREKEIYVPRLVSIETYAKRHHELLAPEANMYLESGTGVDTLYWATRNLTPLAADELKIKVTATALNFRDVLKAMHLYPGDAGDFGYECAGVVIETGTGVSEFKVGDKVIATGQGLLSGEAVVKAVQTQHLPKNLSPEQGASTPIVFLTADYAFNQLANIKKGQKILIHAASGGVGLAAIEFARLKGAEIYATASLSKQAYLKEQGIKHIYDSRSTAFSEQIKKDTKGEGVDVVLNSLSGEGFIEASLACLKEGGVFLEISKINIYSIEQMDKLRPDVRYHVIEMDKRMKEVPEEIKQALQVILDSLEKGHLNPLPVTDFPVTQTIQALQYLQQAKQIGKVVVSYPAAFMYKPDGTYLITGGSGGLGLELAKHLISKGAKHLALTSRSKAKETLLSWITEQQEQGIEITHYSADVSDQNAIKAVFDAIANTAYPLNGIFHAAGLVKDGLLNDLNIDDFETVLAPKVKGSSNLHRLSQHLNLDLFVLFSSVASLFGNTGQSNYAAANAFMDGLARKRHQQGLPAMSINWGPFAKVGMAANLETIHRAQGMYPLDAPSAFEVLDTLLTNPNAQVGIMEMDWSKITLGNSPYLSYLGAGVIKTVSEWSVICQNHPLEKQKEILTDKIRKLLGQVLNVSDVKEIDLNKNFFEFGMDSLMAVELKNCLQNYLGYSMDLNASFVFDNPTITQMVTGIMLQTHSNVEKNAIEETDLGAIDSMGEKDLDELLNKLAKGE